ncbi:hypothetical protein [Prochlorococcus marinus]|uniref:Uncharacterized protein n=1 Tax=Prochlorococcus marinus str. PAC1 TaxID=59924 RepID=A0A0A2C2Z2_PROMR|nr:hypothetical protein [Prochlorococcus marinus]KGG19275.1 hypothetical protein EV03_1655 [Prochlorococcus marinus str. PAC1]
MIVGTPEQANIAKNRSTEILAKYAIKYVRVSTLVQGEEDNKGKGGSMEETIKEWQKTDNPEWVSGIMNKEANQNNSLIMKSIKWLFNSD